jgi:flagellar biosynthesis chaperone FliJ
MKHRRFLKGIEILKERHIQSEQQKQEKIAQKLLDEFAMRKGFAKRSK